MRLIDANVITDKEIVHYLGREYASCTPDVMDLLNDQPTIEAVPVVERDKIIDEFVGKLKKRYPIMENDLFTVNDKLHDEIDKIAEQMKGEQA